MFIREGIRSVEELGLSEEVKRLIYEVNAENSILKRSDNGAMFSTLGTNCSFRAVFSAVKTSS
jgi:hypothetical protein